MRECEVVRRALQKLIFVFGLAESITSGFAGFWGGLPFWVIATIVMLMAIYDFYDETIRKKL